MFCSWRKAPYSCGTGQWPNVLALLLQKSKRPRVIFLYYCICLLIYLCICQPSVFQFCHKDIFSCTNKRKFKKSVSRCLNRCQLFDKLQICLTHCTCFSASCGMQTSVFMRAWEPIGEYCSQADTGLWNLFLFCFYPFSLYKL